MLSRLSIQNYALIESLEIEFPEGFSVITGETGAGKSILLGALGLILGQRSDSSFMIDPDRKCVVEGTFLIGNYKLESFFEQNELDYDDKCILRREIAVSGKSRAFINDTPVQLNVMKSLGDRLLNIHSQHSITTLNDVSFQLALLDDYASVQNQMAEYREMYARHENLLRELEALIRAEQKSRTDLDYYNFLFDELSSASLKEGEQEETEKRLGILTHSEEIKTGLMRMSYMLNESEQSVLSQFTEIVSLSLNISRYHPQLEEITTRLKSNQIDLKDISHSIGTIAGEITFDPKEMELLAERLDMIYKLEKKHHVSTVEELIALREQFRTRVEATGTLEQKIEALRPELQTMEGNLRKMAQEISGNRKKIIPELEKNITDLLKQLGMPDARFRVRHETVTDPTPDGIDRVGFLFSSNKGVDLDDVSRIASGGELSRLMLTIKSLISGKNLLPTIIFDEIDIGVSGEIAVKMGTILRKMAKKMQVIAITHLPQIAGMGETHYLVYKTDDGKMTRSLMKELTHDERIHEIAKMLSSDKVTASASRTASELLKN